MQLVLYDQLRRARSGAGTEEGAGPLLPRDARELVDGADQQRRRVFVQGLVHHVAGQRTRIRAEVARAIGAMEMELVLRGTVAVRGVERCTAPWTAFHQQVVLRSGLAVPDLLHELPGLVESVGTDLAPDPDADVDRRFPQPCGISPANQLQGAHHPRRAFELLPGQQAQRVTHEGRGPSTRIRILQAAPDDQERDQTQICLRLAAAGRKPDEIQHISKIVVFADRGHHDREQESQLKGTPAVVVGLGLLAADTIGLAHLIEHRPVRQPERFSRERVDAKHLAASSHSIEGNGHSVADTVRGCSFTGVWKLGGGAFLLGNPVGVPAGEAGQFVRHGRFGEACKTEHRILTAGIDGHHRYLRLGHEVRSDPRLASRIHIPVRGGSMTDGIDTLLSVLKLDLLLFFREQARIDPRIFDELAALDRALEPRLEQ